MAFGHDISMLVKRDQRDPGFKISLVLMIVNLWSMIFISLYAGQSLSYKRDKRDHWFVISLCEWSNMNRTHCYALSIILICIPIFFMIIHSIGYVINIILFDKYDFFGIDSAFIVIIPSMIILYLGMIIYALINANGLCIPNAIHKIKSCINQFYEVDTNYIHSHTM